MNNYPAWARKKLDMAELGIEPPPFEYLEMQLCRDVYHCLPSQLDQEDWRRISVHQEMMNIEAEVNEAKAKNG
jgi:hypothetical protein